MTKAAWPNTATITETVPREWATACDREPTTPEAWAQATIENDWPAFENV